MRAKILDYGTDPFYNASTRDLEGIVYNDGYEYEGVTYWGTQDITYGNYDRQGRPHTITDGQGTRTLGYDVAGQLESESIGNMNLARDIDGFGRSEGFVLKEGTSVIQNIDYGYDSQGRFLTVNTQSEIFTYTWAEGANLLTGYSSAGGSPAVSVAYTYEDNRDLKTDVVNAAVVGGIGDPANVSTYTYIYDEIGRRKQRTDDSSLINKFKYNERSEVVEADMDGATGYEDVYVFDDIGNRTAVSENGVTPAVSYVPDNLNQYDTVGGTSFTHDFDGNLTADGEWVYTWNAENRLVEMESSASVSLADRQKLKFAYDVMGRRYSKKVYAYNIATSAFELQTTTTFVYNGWNMIHETTTPQSPALPVTRSYVWGLDLSQTLQGAGGVGGLLCSVHSPQGGSAATYYATADANGNITDYVNETGAVSASFTYDAFGQVVNESIAQGLEPNAFPHRFSSKYQDLETDLNYYGYRYYSAEMGRWLNRDPIGERGGVNLYVIANNNSIDFADPLGLKNIELNFSGDEDGMLGTDWIDNLVASQVQNLADTLSDCCLIYDIGCDITLSGSLVNNPELERPKDGVYNNTLRDKLRLRKNLKSILGDGTPVLVTGMIGDSGRSAFTLSGYGVVISPRVMFHSSTVLVHELAHMGGYMAPKGSEFITEKGRKDKRHHNDPRSVMHPSYSKYGSNEMIDKNVCCALSSLAE